jgi:hypothetical protein
MTKVTFGADGSIVIEADLATGETFSATNGERTVTVSKTLAKTPE